MTKLIVALSATLLAASFAGAADFILKDGRLLCEAVVTKQDAATVTFRHAGGFTQVEKSKLPEPLAAEYPFDAAQAKLEEEQQRQDAQARRAETERLYTLRVQLAAAAPRPVKTPADEEPKQNIASSTSTPSWMDTYNAESWRLMRNRDRDHNDDRDRRGDHNDCDTHRDHERPAPPTPPNPAIHMTPDVKMVGFDTPQSSEVPPDADTTHSSPRFRHL